MEFAEIKAEDFSSFTPGVEATYITIEKTVTKIGGGGKAGADYKKLLFKEAGWKQDALTGYTKKPELAAEVFNRVREALSQTQDKDKLLQLVKDTVAA